ncbi:MAG: exo-alpha-sialidase [Clostridia bacterium]|nr:exo-alpha-sialidase [Clostridia bacterium]
MKLQISEPQIVVMGPPCREVGWGPYQFASLYRLTDGRLLYTFNLGLDSITNYGHVRGGYVSDDNGKTWTAGYDADYFHLMGVPAGNGETIRLAAQKALPWSEELQLLGEDGEYHPVDPDLTKKQYLIVDDVKHPDFNHGWIFERYGEGATVPVVEESKILPERHLMTFSGEGLLARPFPLINHIRISPIDGSLWIADYGIRRNPETGERDRHFSNNLYRSVDHGRTWELMHYLPFDPKALPENDPEAHRREGWSENDVGWAPDGTMFRIIRTWGAYYKAGECRCRASYITHSTDGGKTWEAPSVFDFCGVMPSVLTLKCGATLATYGRPGLFLRASFDPSARRWEEHIELIHCDGAPITDVNAVDLVATCAYADLVEIDDHTAGFAYSDFTVKDENGVPHKCLMYRTVTVVED